MSPALECVSTKQLIARALLWAPFFLRVNFKEQSDKLKDSAGRVKERACTCE